MFILFRLFRQARIRSYDADDISKFSSNDVKFARFAYKDNQFSNLNPTQKAAIIQSHLSDRDFFEKIGLPLLTQKYKGRQQYPVFAAFDKNFKIPVVKKPWYKRLFSFGKTQRPATEARSKTAHDYILSVADSKLIPFILYPEVYANHEAATMKFMLAQKRFNPAEHWESIFDLARSNDIAATLFLRNSDVQKHLKGNQKDLYDLKNLELWDQFAEMKAKQFELHEYITKQLHTLFDGYNPSEALSIHQRPCWDLIKDQEFMKNHRNNAENAVIYQEIGELLNPQQRRFGTVSKQSSFMRLEFTHETRIQMLVDKAQNDINTARIVLIDSPEALTLLNSKQIASILHGQADNAYFLKECLEVTRTNKQPRIDLYQLITSNDNNEMQKDTADIIISNEKLGNYLSCQQLQDLQHRFYSQPLDRNHFITLELNSVGSRTAANVNAQKKRLLMQVQSDKTGNGDDSQEEEINHAHDELYRPLLNREKVNALIEEKQARESRLKDEFDDVLKIGSKSRKGRNHSGFGVFPEGTPGARASSQNSSNTYGWNKH